MSNDKKPELTLEQRVTKLTADLADALQQIQWMRTRGGFTDAKTHSMRSTRIEQRLELVEYDNAMLRDVITAYQEAWHDHLQDRHNSAIERDSAIDTTKWRQVRHRLKTWVEKRGLLVKRRDDTSKLRPQAASS